MEAGADVEAQAAGGARPLHLAAQYGHVRVGANAGGGWRRRGGSSCWWSEAAAHGGARWVCDNDAGLTPRAHPRTPALESRHPRASHASWRAAWLPPAASPETCRADLPHPDATAA
jgi:hypothetical protein